MQTPDANIFRLLSADLSKNFEIDVQEQILDVDNFFELFRERLFSQILDLLQNDYNRLLALLYRIDVDEGIVENALQGQDIRLVSERLTDAVIERLVQKIKHRMRG